MQRCAVEQSGASNTPQLSFKVLKAFIQLVMPKQSAGRQIHLIDSFQMTAMWQGSFRGLKKGNFLNL